MDSLSTIQFVYCGAVIFGAYVVRGTAGFGGGLVAIPLLLMVLPLTTVLPVVTILNMVSSLQVMRDRKHIQWRELLKLLPFSAIGIALGLYIFTAIDLDLLTKAFAIFLILYAVYGIVSARRETSGQQKRMPKWILVPVGITAGFLATIFGGSGGGFYAVYLDGLRLTRHQFRATITSILLVVAGLRSIGYVQLGFYDREALTLLAASLPLMLLGAYVATLILNRMSDRVFRTGIAVILIGSGVTLLFK